MSLIDFLLGLFAGMLIVVVVLFIILERKEYWKNARAESRKKEKNKSV
jgi:hypothetical protein